MVNDSATDDRDAPKPDFDRVEQSSRFIAKALNLIESAADTMEGVCEINGWDDAVVFQIETAQSKLGCALATLVTWYDDIQ